MAISVVQSKMVADAASGSFTTPTQAGNTVVVVVGTGNASNVTQTITGITLGGSAGNFAQAEATQSAFQSGTGTATVMIWGDPNCAGGQTAIAISGTNLNLGAATGNGWVAYEIAGLLSTSTLSVMLDTAHTHNSGITGTAVSTGTTGTTTQANAIALGVLISFVTLSGFTGSFTTTQINDGSGTFGSGAEQILSSTGTQSYGATAASSTVWAGAVVTLLGAPAAPALMRSPAVPPGRQSPMAWQRATPPAPAQPPAQQPVQLPGLLPSSPSTAVMDGSLW